MRLLITGAAGFVGGHLARHCLESGDEVWGFDRAGAGMALRRGLQFLTADLLAPGTLSGVLDRARPRAIVHLAAQSSVPMSQERPVATWEANVIGTMNLYEAVRARGKPYPRIAFIGSGDVYGDVPAKRLPIPAIFPELSITSQPVVCSPFVRLSAFVSM